MQASEQARNVLHLDVVNLTQHSYNHMEIERHYVRYFANLLAAEPLPFAGKKIRPTDSESFLNLFQACKVSEQRQCDLFQSGLELKPVNCKGPRAS